MSYIAIYCKDCDNIFCGWENDKPVKFDDHPETIQEYIKQGHKLKEVTDNYFDKNLNGCQCNSNEKQETIIQRIKQFFLNNLYCFQSKCL